MSVWCCVNVDIDECAAGEIAEECKNHGVCNGFQPVGNWTCACNPGYELFPNRTGCKCQYSVVSTHVLQWSCLVECQSIHCFLDCCVTADTHTRLLTAIFHVNLD